MQASGDDVLRQRPRLTPRDAARLASELFGIRGEASDLPGERDRNFLLRAGERRCVLKVAAADEDPAVLDLQHTALARVRERAPGLGVPQPLPALDGGSIVEADCDGTRHAVRLLTWLDGTPWAAHRPPTDALRRELGAFLARLDVALQGLEHPALHRELFWDLRLAPAVVRRHLDAVAEAGDRALIERCLARFETVAAPALDGLRRSPIHNDANDHNVLVAPSLDGGRIAGLIDFGDLVHSFTVGELAVAAAYAMLEQPEPLAAAAALIEGYHGALPLTEPELSVLFDLLVLRLCTSVTLSASRRLQTADPYLAISEAPAWRLLRRLDTTSPALACATFRHACGLPPCARAPRVLAWLRDADAHPVLDADFGRAAVLDMSVGSLELDDAASVADLQRAVDLALADAGVVVGRYDEPRLLYQTDAFADRTIHLGLDLYAAAGTEVRAPLDGTVHGFADNAAPLDYGPTILLRHAPTPDVEFYTLYGHLGRESLRGLRVGDRVPRGARLGSIGNAEVNGGWPPHLHLQIMLDALGAQSDFPGVAPAGQRALWTALCPDPNLLVRLPAERFPPSVPSPEQTLAARHATMSRALSVSYRRPLKIVRGRGVFLYDHEGRAFLDAVNNVPHVGHGHPHVVRAGQRQMAVLNTNTRYLHDGVVDYARRLLATLPAPLEVCFFVNSGSEANELALRLAHAHTGGRDCIVLDGAYHGHSQALIDLSPYKHDGPGGRGAPASVHKVPMPDAYRGAHKGSDAGARYAAAVADVVARLAEQGRRPAAFFAEAMLGCGGQVVPPPGFFAAAYAQVQGAGGVCVADEVQIGFGRSGSCFWGFELHGVVPDIVTLGKPMGNGHPIGAVVTTRAIARSFETGMEFFSTFGGNPVSCAIAAAVLDVIEREDLQANALRVGEQLVEELRALQQRHALIGDVRGHGLYLGVELVRDRATLEPAAAEASHVVERMKDRGVLLSTDGPLHNVLKIKPPLVFTAEDAERLCAALDAVLAESALQPAGR